MALILKVYQINAPVSDLEAKLTHFIERRVGVRLEDAPPIILLNGYLPLAQMPGSFTRRRRRSCSRAAAKVTGGHTWKQCPADCLVTPRVGADNSNS